MMKLVTTLACVMVLAGAALADSPPAAPQAPPASSTPGMVYVATLSNGFTVRFDHRQIIEDVSRLYMTAGQENYIDIPTEEIATLSQEQLPPSPAPPVMSVAQAQSAADIKSVISAASDKHLVDADLIDSLIRFESGFNPRAVSPKGARGLMQLMPDTAAKLGVQDSFDSWSNVEGGTRYLRQLLARYDNDLIKALAAYNAGPQRVEQYHGVPPYRETRAYVAGIIRDFNRKKLAERKAQANKPATKSPTKSPPSAAKPAVTPVPGS